MPLIKSASDKAFKQNVRTEMHAHPGRRAQNLAIAYSMQRRKKHAYGGATGNGVYADGFEGYAEGGQTTSSTSNPNSPSSMGVPTGVLSAMNIGKKAHGGKVHEDEAEDKKLIHKEMAKTCKKCGYAEGGEVKHRAVHAFHGGDESLDSGLEQHV